MRYSGGALSRIEPQWTTATPNITIQLFTVQRRLVLRISWWSFPDCVSSTTRSYSYPRPRPGFAVEILRLTVGEWRGMLICIFSGSFFLWRFDLHADGFAAAQQSGTRSLVSRQSGFARLWQIPQLPLVSMLIFGLVPEAKHSQPAAAFRPTLNSCIDSAFYTSVGADGEPKGFCIGFQFTASFFEV